MKRIMLSLVMMSQVVMAQDKPAQDKKCHYFMVFHSGFMAGESARSVTSTIGITQGAVIGKGLRVGAGIGFDSYRDWQAVPFTLHASYDLFGKKNVVFVQSDYGWSSAWKIKEVNNYDVPTSETGGKVFGTMIGYRIAAGNARLYVAAGYKFQQVFSRQTPTDLRYMYGVSQQTETNFERFVLSIGIGWK